MAKLDILEDHPNYYIRDLYDIEASNETHEKIKAWIYVIRNFRKELLNQPFYESYSNSGNHEKRYMERYLRDDANDHKTEILSNDN